MVGQLVYRGLRRLAELMPLVLSVAFVSQFTADYGNYESLADVFRQIGHDERVHKQESETQLTQPRFH